MLRKPSVESFEEHQEHQMVTKTMPTAAHTSRLIVMSVTIIAIAGKGSLLRYGTRE